MTRLIEGQQVDTFSLPEAGRLSLDLLATVDRQARNSKLTQRLLKAAEQQNTHSEGAM